MWAAGAVAAMSSITFPAVSALVSRTADADQQGELLGLWQLCGHRCSNPVLSWGTQSLGLLLTPYVCAGLSALKAQGRHVYCLSFVVGTLNS